MWEFSQKTNLVIIQQNEREDSEAREEKCREISDDKQIAEILALNHIFIILWPIFRPFCRWCIVTSFSSHFSSCACNDNNNCNIFVVLWAFFYTLACYGIVLMSLFLLLLVCAPDVNAHCYTHKFIYQSIYSPKTMYYYIARTNFVSNIKWRNILTKLK